MLAFSRPLFAFFNKRLRRNSENQIEKKWIFDFSRSKNFTFNIKPESSYNANLSENAFTLELKKQNCIVWEEIPGQEYYDHIIDAKLRLGSSGGYIACGFLFHIDEMGAYYMILVSSRGYFRLDVVKDSAPRPLIAWTEISDFDRNNINLNITVYGSRLIFIINGKWAGDADNNLVKSGKLAFAIASYETDKISNYSAKAYLENLSVDTRTKAIEENFKKWTDESNINADSRLRLSETFAVMGDASRSLEQIKLAWKRREEAFRSVSGAFNEIRTRRELLLAARMSFNLGQYREADDYLSTLIDQWLNTPEGTEAVNEKVKTLSELNKFSELKIFTEKHGSLIEKNVDMYGLIARCYWNLKDYKNAANVWIKAFSLDKENGVYAVNAAGALEQSGKKDKAFACYLDAGRIFIRQNNQEELAALIPKLEKLGVKNWEARAVIGKWAFSVEDYERCETEFAIAEKLRVKEKPRPPADPAVYYLWGIVLNLKGKNYNAVRLLEKAVKLAPDYGLFRFKLAELKINAGKYEPSLADELKQAYALSDNDPEIARQAGTLLLNVGDKLNAAYFLKKIPNANN